MMSKSYGSDDGGEFVLWTTRDGQMNKKYISGPLEGEHQGYNPTTRRSFSTGYDRDWRDEEEEDADDSGGGGCYIATAVTHDEAPAVQAELMYLKRWRYSVLEGSTIGNRLSTHYRNTAPRLAQNLTEYPRLSSFVKNWFVTPGIRLAQAREKNPKGKAIYSVLLFLLFVVGLMFGELARLYTKS